MGMKLPRKKWRIEYGPKNPGINYDAKMNTSYMINAHTSYAWKLLKPSFLQKLNHPRDYLAIRIILAIRVILNLKKYEVLANPNCTVPVLHVCLFVCLFVLFFLFFF